MLHLMISDFFVSIQLYNTKIFVSIQLYNTKKFQEGIVSLYENMLIAWMIFDIPDTSQVLLQHLQIFVKQG